MQYSPQSATPEAQSEGGLAASPQLRHYWHVILERRWLVIASFVSVLALCLVYLYTAPKVYQAVVRLQIDREAESSLNLRDVVVSMSTMDQDYLQTQYKNLLSRSLIEAVIKKEKLTEDSRYNKKLDVAQAVADDITVSPIRLSRLVDVKVEHTSPGKAAAIANRLASEFIDNNQLLRQKRTLDMLFFLRSQASGLERDVQKAEEDIQNYRTQTKFVSFDERMNIIAEALSQSQARYAEAKSRAQSAAAIAAEIEKHVASGKTLDTFPSIAVDPQIKQLQTQVASLENELAGLLQRYKDKHPNVIQVRSRIAEARGAIDRAALQIAVTVRSEAMVAKSQEESLAKLVAEWEDRQTEWSRAKMQYDVLSRKAETSKALFNLVLGKMKEIEMVQKDKANNIRIVDEASTPVRPAKPNVVLTILLGMVLAVVASIGLALFVNYLDDSIKSQDDVETYLRLPFLGYVPNIKSNSIVERYLNSHLHPQSNAAESFRTVRAAISLGSRGNKLKLITVTSTIPSEGKSLVASNLAVVIAQTGMRTLLIDADLRRPSVQKAYQLHSPAGLSAYLTEKVNNIDELIHTSEVPNLDVICVGSTPSQPSELIGSRRMIQLLQELGRRYDRIVMDCPPVSAVSDPLVLSALADGVVFVSKFNKVRRDHARKSVQRMQEAGIHICGVLLNDIDFEGRDSYYYSYYYYQNRYYSGYYRTRPTATPEPKKPDAQPEPSTKA
jgi:capsular exopolysaccharide synthesis family protein